MTTMENAPAGRESGEGVKQVGQTSSQSTHMPDTWHQQCEWENAASYADGYAAGWHAAELAIAREISQAIGVQAYNRRDVIRWLIRTTGQPAARRPEPYSSPENGTMLTVQERQLLGTWAA